MKKFVIFILISLAFVLQSKAFENFLFADTTFVIDVGTAAYVGDNPASAFYADGGKITVFTHSGMFIYTHKINGITHVDTVYVHVNPITTNNSCHVVILGDTMLKTALDTIITLQADQQNMTMYRWYALDAQHKADIIGDTTATSIQVKSHPSDTAVFILETMLEDINQMVFNGGFEEEVNGNHNLGFTSDYTYTTATTANGANGGLWNEGTYALGTSSGDYHKNFKANPCTHSQDDGDYYLMANGSTGTNVNVFSQTVDVEPNTRYIVKFLATNISDVQGNLPKLQFSVNGQQLGSVLTIPQAHCQWNEYYQLWDSGNDTLATITILNQNTAGGGNDFGIDNISYYKMCVSIDTIKIVNDITLRTNIEQTICQGDSVIFGGEIIYTSGKYVDTITLENGVDSVITLTLIVNPVFDTLVSDTICEGTIYPFNGQQLVSSGDYTAHLQTENGCDSTVYLALIVNPISETHIDTTIFSWDNFYYNDTTISDDGTHRFTYQNIVGCDSLVTITIHYNKTVSQKADICAGEEYILGDRTLTTTGIYADTLLAQNGNDSIVLLSLTVHPSYYDTIEAKIGVGNVYNRYGFYESDSGTYVHSEQTLFGCDSITVLHLIVDEPLVIYTPNAITPGADNNNTFRVYTADENIVLESLRVYFRWGGLIFETDDIEQGWNGKYKNDFCEQGAYVYEVIYYRKDNPDKKYKKTGELMLIY